MISELFDAVQSFYQRFDLNITKANTIRTFNEEVFEFTEAAIKDKHDSFTEGDEYGVLNEAADAIYTLVGVLASLGFDAEDLEEAIRSVMNKNNAKNGLTHEVRKGKVTKREG